MRPIPFNALSKMFGANHTNQTLVHSAAIDSRKVKVGDLFFALEGERVDGHLFLQEAANKGAVGAVVKKDFKGEDAGLPLLRVQNVLETLQELARKVLATRTTQVVAITGSIGKTMTKDFATALLRSSYRVASSPYSYNSQATLPLSILMAEGDEDIHVLEMGMSKPGEMDKLISIAPPDVAVITTVAIQHACYFSDGLAGIYREKGKVFSHDKTRLGICHRDIDQYVDITEIGTCEKISFSLVSKDVNYFLEEIEKEVRIYPAGEPPLEIEINLPIKPLYQNYLAAVCVARSFDVPWTLIREASKTLRLPPMRFERVEKQGVVFINDAYNANPDSMKAALESLPCPEKGGKVIAVLGEMTELGMYTEGGHALVAETALAKADLLLCIGSHCEVMQKIWKKEKKPVELFETCEELKKYLKESVAPGDVVLLKGARSHELEKIVEGF